MVINSLANRLPVISNKIPLNWLNMSMDTFKVNCKKIFLFLLWMVNFEKWSAHCFYHGCLDQTLSMAFRFCIFLETQNERISTITSNFFKFQLPCCFLSTTCSYGIPTLKEWKPQLQQQQQLSSQCQLQMLHTNNRVRIHRCSHMLTNDTTYIDGSRAVVL